MKIAVIVTDSSLGAALADLHTARGDTVVKFTRKPGNETARWFDLSNKRSWTIPVDCDRIYYLIRGTTGDEQADFALGSLSSVRYLQWMSETLVTPCEIVVFSSGLGSISSIQVPGDINYRMMKAALNMGIKCLSMRTKGIKWLLLNPGLVYTKATKDSIDAGTFAHGSNAISPEVAAEQIDRLVTSGKYPNGSFVDSNLDTVLKW